MKGSVDYNIGNNTCFSSTSLPFQSPHVLGLPLLRQGRYTCPQCTGEKVWFLTVMTEQAYPTSSPHLPLSATPCFPQENAKGLEQENHVRIHFSSIQLKITETLQYAKSRETTGRKRDNGILCSGRRDGCLPNIRISLHLIQQYFITALNSGLVLRRRSPGIL